MYQDYIILKRFSTLFIFSSLALFARAQNQPAAATMQQNASLIKEAEPYGKVDMADMGMKSCDFEPDANAEVLFDKAKATSEREGLTMERHTRIKIFNEFGKSEANVRLEYVSYLDAMVVNNLKAESVNLEDGKMVFTPLDKKGAYTEKVDKTHSALVFAIPNVKPGTVIEYTYQVVFRYYPTWYFQSNIPTRYSELAIDFPISAQLRSIPHISQPLVKDVGNGEDYVQVKAMANIHSLPNEAYMYARKDNLQRMEYLGVTPIAGSWSKIGDLLLTFSDFRDELDRSVSGAGVIVKKAKTLKTDDEKIAFVFDTVRNRMKWNDLDYFSVADGTVRAWDKGLGNSAEINIILYQLLRGAGIKAYPMVVSTKNNGKINPANADPFSFNKTIVYIPVDSTKYYMLDATDKYGLYNTSPAGELNSFGLSIDERHKEYKFNFIEALEPAMQSVFLNAEIKPDGKMSGTAEITSTSYNKIDAARDYNTDGEKKYVEALCNKDNNIKVSSLKLHNMDVDSLPLTQNMDFSMNLTGSDENYIYFNTNLFTLMGDNPFKSEQRYSDIDFGYRDNYSISGVYKLPVGYKTDALPKTITIIMPDKSMIFKRTVIEDSGAILVRYMLNHVKTIYFKKDYPDIRAFYKQMYELLNEQIVLKKG